MSLISRHFSIDEFRCHSGERYPIEWEDNRLQELVTVLDTIRDTWSLPIVVVCGYRSLAYNKALREASIKRNGGTTGVALHSQHTEGRAADIAPFKRNLHNVGLLHDVIKQLHADGKIPSLGGLGYYPASWIHVDTRPRDNGHVIQWDGNGGGNGQDQ